MRAEQRRQMGPGAQGERATLGLSGEAVWADRGKEKRGELGPGRERKEWAAGLSWVWVALGWFSSLGFWAGLQGFGLGSHV